MALDSGLDDAKYRSREIEVKSLGGHRLLVASRILRSEMVEDIQGLAGQLGYVSDG